MALALSTFRLLPVALRRGIVRVVAPSYVVGVVAVMRNDVGELLLLRERHHDGWALPGGLLARRESPADALVRELQEEIGVVLPPAELAEPVVGVDPKARRVDLIYQLKAGSGVRPRAQEPEVLEVGWFAPGVLPELFEPTLAVLRRTHILTGSVES
jgi:ADP-ribose pyrophosphatase YjhB (NUDIX family)